MYMYSTKKYKDTSTAEETYGTCFYEMITFSYKQGGGFFSGKSGSSYIAVILTSLVVSPIV